MHGPFVTASFAIVTVWTACSDALAEPPAWLAFGRSHEGRPLDMVRIGSHGGKLLVVGSLYGDEHAGAGLAERLAAELMRDAEAGQLANSQAVVVRDPNPDGRIRATAVNAHGVDLNRNFPTSNWQPVRSGRHVVSGRRPATQPEVRALVALVDAWKPSRLLILSAAGHTTSWHYIGSDEAFADRFSAACQTRPTERRLSTAPGSLASYAAERGIETIVLSVPAGQSIDASWSQLEEALRLAANVGEPAAAKPRRERTQPTETQPPASPNVEAPTETSPAESSSASGPADLTPVDPFRAREQSRQPATKGSRQRPPRSRAILGAPVARANSGSANTLAVKPVPPVTRQRVTGQSPANQPAARQPRRLVPLGPNVSDGHNQAPVTTDARPAEQQASPRTQLLEPVSRTPRAVLPASIGRPQRKRAVDDVTRPGNRAAQQRSKGRPPAAQPDGGTRPADRRSNSATGAERPAKTGSANGGTTRSKMLQPPIPLD